MKQILRPSEAFMLFTSTVKAVDEDRQAFERVGIATPEMSAEQVVSLVLFRVLCNKYDDFSSPRFMCSMLIEYCKPEYSEFFILYHESLLGGISRNEFRSRQFDVSLDIPVEAQKAKNSGHRARINPLREPYASEWNSVFASNCEITARLEQRALDEIVDSGLVPEVMVFRNVYFDGKSIHSLFKSNATDLQFCFQLVRCYFMDNPNVVDSDPAWGVLYNIYKRIYGLSRSLVHTLNHREYAATEVIARSALELCANLNWIIAGDANKNAVSYLLSFLDQRKKDIESINKDLGSELDYSAEKVYREILSRSYSIVGIDIDAHAERMPNKVYVKFMEAGMVEAYRTLYAELSRQLHGEAEDTLNDISARCNGLVDPDAHAKAVDEERYLFALMKMAQIIEIFLNSSIKFILYYSKGGSAPYEIAILKDRIARVRSTMTGINISLRQVGKAVQDNVYFCFPSN